MIELIGGIEPARSFQLAALAAGKSVVTANKQLLSQHGAELLQTAEDNGAFLRFEASSVGAVPVIKVLRESLAAARISGVMGIVNGTTNYILSAMAQTGAEYAPTLKKAQELGYAEADPTEDVTGKDAAAKMAILSSIAFHSRVNLADVEHQGIEAVTDVDVARGRELGLVPKLLGVAKLIDERVNVRVYPCFIPAEHPLAGVSGAYNAVFLESDSFDNLMLFGPGAGGIADRLGRDRRRDLDRQHGARRLCGQLHLLQGSSASTPAPRWSRGSTCACGWPTSPACWPPSPAPSATRA